MRQEQTYWKKEAHSCTPIGKISTPFIGDSDSALKKIIMHSYVHHIFGCAFMNRNKTPK